MNRPAIHPRMAERIGLVVSGTLPNQCNSFRPTWISDGGGGQIESAVPVLQNEPCRVEPGIMGGMGSGYEKATGGRTQTETTWRITFAAARDVDPTDRLEIGDRVFQMVFPEDPQSYQPQTAIICKELV